MKVKGIAECSLGAFCNTLDLHEAIICLEKQFCLHLSSLGAFCNTLDLHEAIICLEKQFCLHLSGRLRQVLL